MPISPESAGELVERARAGDAGAWDGLVDAFSPLVWGIVRSHRLDQGDAADVSQTTWLRLVENLDRLGEPQHVGAWLATTARRECSRVLRLARRQVLVEDEAELDRAGLDQPALDALLLGQEEAAAVRAAFAQLPPRCQHLLRSLLFEPTATYEELSVTLDMPIGSIGPTRMRCVEKLRALAAQRGVSVRP